MISKKEKQIHDYIISNIEFHKDFSKINKEINYDQYLLNEEKQSSFPLKKYKIIFCTSLLILMMLFPIMMFNAKKFKNAELCTEIIYVIEDDVKCENVILNDLVSKKHIEISLSQQTHKYFLANFKVEINGQILENIEYKSSSNQFVLNLSELELLEDGGEAKISYEIYDYTNKKIAYYELFIKCRHGEETYKYYFFK